MKSIFGACLTPDVRLFLLATPSGSTLRLKPRLFCVSASPLLPFPSQLNGHKQLLLSSIQTKSTDSFSPMAWLKPAAQHTQQILGDRFMFLRLLLTRRSYEAHSDFGLGKVCRLFGLSCVSSLYHLNRV